MKKAKTSEAIKPSPDFGLDELIRALQANITVDNAGYFTMRELADGMGHNKDWVEAQLGTLHKQGRLQAGRKSCVCIAGYTVRVPAYRLKPPEAGAAK